MSFKLNNNYINYELKNLDNEKLTQKAVLKLHKTSQKNEELNLLIKKNNKELERTQKQLDSLKQKTKPKHESKIRSLISALKILESNNQKFLIIKKHFDNKINILTKVVLNAQYIQKTSLEIKENRKLQSYLINDNSISPSDKKINLLKYKMTELDLVNSRFKVELETEKLMASLQSKPARDNLKKEKKTVSFEQNTIPDHAPEKNKKKDSLFAYDSDYNL